MKTVTLADGTVVRVGCRHITGYRDIVTRLPDRPWLHAPRTCMVRLTEAYVLRPREPGETSDEVLARAEAICSPDDNFCRRTGRKIAASRLLHMLLSQDGGSLDLGSFHWKENRRKVFEALCPELTPLPRRQAKRRNRDRNC